MVERIEFDLLFRWFVGLGVNDPVWDATTFTHHVHILEMNGESYRLAQSKRRRRTPNSPPDPS